MRVVVVSENAAERLRAASGLLADDDVEVVEATGAADAHDLVEAGGVDVLVIDGDLVPEGGFSVLYEIRAAGELRGEATPPAIVLTSREQDRFLARWAGANAHVRKPVDPFELARLVRSLESQPAAPRVSDESDEELVAALEDDVAPTLG